MSGLPDAIVPLLSSFASLFDARTWRKVQILLTGVILAPGRCTVFSARYALGLQEGGDWACYHHVLSRASWSSLWSSLDVGWVLPDSWSNTRCRWGCCTWPSMRPRNSAGGPKSRPRGCIGTRSAFLQPLRQGQEAAPGPPDVVGGPAGCGPCPS